MTTWCRQIRSSLTAGEQTREEAEVAEHLAHCADCARFAVRLEVFRSALRDHHAGIEPDAGFAARLRGRLPDTSADLMGRAAWRLLPLGAAGTVALTFALAWSGGGLAGPIGGSAADDAPLVADAQLDGSPIDDPLGWLLETTDEAGVDDSTEDR